MIERWCEIKGYEGKYEVSDMGNIRIAKSHIPIKLQASWAGYIRVSLWKNGNQKKYSVHRLVAEAFIPNPKGKPQVNHIDENKANNNVSNLQWVTNLENMRHGTCRERQILHQLNRKDLSRPVGCYDDYGNLLKVYPSRKEASRQTGINISCIQDSIKCRRPHGGKYIWRDYEEDV